MNIIFWQRIKKIYDIFSQKIEKYLILLVITGFIGGIVAAQYSQQVVGSVQGMVSSFIEFYSLIAPVAIYIILAPSLTKMFTAREGGFGSIVIRYFAIRKIFACLWAILFMLIVVQMPFLPERSTSVLSAMTQTFSSLVKMATTSSFFYAIYFSIATALIAKRVTWLASLLNSGLSVLENIGKIFLPIIPIFMFAIGTYVYSLPSSLADQIGLPEGSAALKIFSTRFFSIDPNSGTGMLMLYVAGALLTALSCYIWHFSLLVTAKKREPLFSIKSYFKNYWIKVYPLLWATSSETMSAPLNLYLTKRHSPWINDNVRRFVIGLGTTMNINGTLQNVFILGVIVLKVIGYPISIFELLLMIPVVFLVSYGVPGLPGELILFAGPIATLLNLPPVITPIFLALYIGLQIGLPDSFRTGNNSTDNFPAAVIINSIYKKKLGNKKEEEIQNELDVLPEAV